MSAVNRLIIFGRYPVAGETKTRLISTLGPVGAAELQRCLTEQVLQTALTTAWTAPFDLEFCFHGDSKQMVRRWLQSDEIHLTRQCQGDLGRRMYHAMADAFDKGYERVVLVGTDVPEISRNHLIQAFESLTQRDLVFGPSTDGGYWLVGARRKLDVFNGVTFSNAFVLDNTLALAKSKGWSTDCLRPLTDLDTLSDLQKWQPGRNWRKPYLSVIIPVLNEAGHLSKTIKAAKTQDTQVIVVDGGSKDASVGIATAAGADVIFAPQGRAVQLNAGAEAAEGKVLLFLHADTRLPSGFDLSIFETLMDSKVALGAFAFQTDLNQMSMRLIEIGANLRSRFFQMPYGDQGLFIRKDTFEILGGFPEVPIAEDLFLVRLAARIGNVKTLRRSVVTSGRRWKKSGILRTTAVNYLVAAGCLLGKSPHRLEQLHRRWTQSHKS